LGIDGNHLTPETKNWIRFELRMQGSRKTLSVTAGNADVRLTANLPSYDK
jgi:hypothetical protein